MPIKMDIARNVEVHPAVLRQYLVMLFVRLSTLRSGTTWAIRDARE